MAPRPRFATKLFLALAGLVALSTGVSLVLLEELTRRRLEAEFAERFDATRAAFAELQALRARFVSDAVAALARSHPQFRTVLSTASLAADLGLGFSAPDSTQAVWRDANLRLRSLLPSLPIATGSDLFVVTSADGRLLYSAADPERYGDDLSRLALFRETVETGEASGVWTSAKAPPAGARLVPAHPRPAVYQVLGRPVVFEEAVHGVVLAGQRLDRSALVSLGRVSGLELALVAGTEVVASTLPEPAEGDLGRRLAAGAAPSAAAWTLADRPYRARRAPVGASGAPEDPEAARASFVLLAPLDAELAFLRRLRVSLLGAAGGVLLAALALAFALARGISRPVGTLVRAARRVGRGELDTEVALQSRDELGELGRAFNEMTRGLRERDRIRRTLEQYVSREVADEILRHPERAPRAGVRRELTVGFVDIGGFTRLADALAPEAVVARLNEYLDLVCQAILAEDGTVNEFLGDGVVAFWGAPVAQADHAARACRAALACRDRLEALAARWRAAEGPAVSFRLGLHTGELVVGEVGSKERRAYRAVGDAMNLAARLEAANKVYGTRILISEATRAQAGEAVVAREIDTVRVAGRSAPVRVFELVALGPERELDPTTRTLLERYAEALARYRAGDLAKAEALFEACLALAPQDGPSAVLLARTRAFRTAPPPTFEPVFELPK